MFQNKIRINIYLSFWRWYNMFIKFLLRKVEVIMGKYNAMDIANYIIDYADKNDMYMTQLKVQKILYYIQGEFLKEKNDKCFVEDILCWNYGPVVREVWESLYKNGSSQLFIFDYTNCIDSDDLSIIEKVIEERGHKSAFDLVNDTHSEFPWKHAMEENNQVISIESMKKQFCR